MVLAMVAVEPREVSGVARALVMRGLDGEQPAHVAATVTLRRLQCAGLVYVRGAPRRQRVFRITARGRRELALQLGLSRALARA
jgi:DNA-binding PadR family transcriptional regulator